MNSIIERVKNGEEIKALSWKDPYGFLMLHDKIETRSWNTNYRGLVLICITKKPYRKQEVMKISGINIFNKIIKIISNYRAVTESSISANAGNAIAVGELINCRSMKKEDEEKCFVKYYPELFCHVYKDVTPIIPFPWKGKQGWSNVPEDIVKEIKFYKNETTL